MAKYCGKIGYVITKDQGHGIYSEVETERKYYGESFRSSRRLQSGEQVNDNINISNQISVVADPFAMSNYFWIRYAEFMGTKWKVTDVEVQYPRLVLTLGGLYNG